MKTLQDKLAELPADRQARIKQMTQDGINAVKGDAITKTIAVINDLYAKTGEKPTQSAVRTAMGGGSFSTIGEAFRQWQASKPAPQPAPAVRMPSDIENAILSLGADLWGKALAHADERLAKEREALAHKEAVWQDELEEAKEAIATLEKEAELAQAVKEAQLGEMEQLEQLHQQAQKELASAQKELASTQAKLDQSTSTSTAQAGEIKTLTAELATLKNSEAKAQADLAKAEKQATSTAEKLDKMTAKAEAQADELATLKASLATAEATAKTTAEQLKKSEATSTAQASEIKTLTADLATAKAELKASQDQLAKMQAELDKLKPQQAQNSKK